MNKSLWEGEEWKLYTGIKFKNKIKYTIRGPFSDS